MGFNKINNYVEIIRKTEKQFNCKIYIVGGYVRDKVLGLKSIDLDLVVEGDGLAVAKVIHGKLGGKLNIYKKFLTASLKLKNGFVIDIATARTEKYPTPASMPIVFPSNLKSDLFRRDFTINALAFPLSQDSSFPLKWESNLMFRNFKVYEIVLPSVRDDKKSVVIARSRATKQSNLAINNIIDLHGGLEDIKKKQIRVLHSNSFIDDPTRILRAIRYAHRFGFKLEKNTEKWMISAIKRNLLTLVSAPRIRDEFVKALEEQKAKKILEEFKKRGILKIIDNSLNISAISPKQEPVEKRLKKLLKYFTKEQKITFIEKFCLPKKYKQ
ncbi:MAG: hypothetical protein PHE88_04790 [Elusimicrobia bacterium]|nr:hypothetical protein [Elusimicrobiota bacterium]